MWWSKYKIAIAHLKMYSNYMDKTDDITTVTFYYVAEGSKVYAHLLSHHVFPHSQFYLHLFIHLSLPHAIYNG